MNEKLCIVCLTLQVIAPWGLILLGAAMAFFASTEAAERIASAVFVLGFIWLAVTATIAHLVNKQAIRPKQ